MIIKKSDANAKGKGKDNDKTITTLTPMPKTLGKYTIYRDYRLYLPRLEPSEE